MDIYDIDEDRCGYTWQKQLLVIHDLDFKESHVQLTEESQPWWKFYGQM